MEQLRLIEAKRVRDGLMDECRQVLAEHHEFIEGGPEDILPGRPEAPSGECAACEDEWPCWPRRVSLAYIVAQSAVEVVSRELGNKLGRDR